MIKRFRLLAGGMALAVGMVLAPGEVAADPVTLPTANCGVGSVANNCLVFNDFTVYSLGLLTYYQSNFGLYSGLNFTAQSNEASIFVLNFNGQGTPLQGQQGQTVTNIDDPYDALTGNPVGADNRRFLMASQSLNSGGAQNDIPSDPAPNGGTWDNLLSTGTVLNSNTFTSQFDASKFADPACQTNIGNPGCMPLWDAQISDLRAALAGSPLVAFFEFNETGDSGELTGQDLTAWATVTLHSTTTNASITFVFSGNNSLPFQGFAQVADESDILPTANDLWARVHAEICVQTSTGAVFLGECSASPFPSGDRQTVNQALGSNQADFAIFNQTLNDLIYDPNSPYDVITIDTRLAYLNDGGDRLWFGPARFTTNVPEPGTLVLLGVTLLAIASLRRRRDIH